MEGVLPSYDPWNEVAVKVSVACFLVGLIIVAGYIVRLFSNKESKAKYDFIIRYETGVLWVVTLFVVVGAGFLANSNVIVLTPVWVFVRLFSTFSMMMIVALTVRSLLKFYYPFYVEKRLKKLRYKPRISPKTGKPMRLLSEQDEDAYLDEGMQAEEELFSMDYDVWKDEETGYIKIEKYAGHLHAVECPKCNYQTFKVAREEIVKQPEAHTPGEIIKHYACSYCGYRVAESVQLLSHSEVEKRPPLAQKG